MKKIFTSILAGMLMCAFCAACDEPTDSEATDVAFTKYPPQGVSLEWTNLDYARLAEVKTLIINSDKELNNYIEGYYPAIDFSTKTLVLAYGRWSGTAPNGGFMGIFPEGDGYEFQRISERNYVMSANFVSTAMLVMVDWQVAMVVDKLPSGSTIKFNPIILNRL